MAEVERMTVEEVVSYFREGEFVDKLRESLRWVCRQLMEAEVSELIGAELVFPNDRALIRLATSVVIERNDSVSKSISAVRSESQPRPPPAPSRSS
jgi:hypothetical protein